MAKDPRPDMLGNIPCIGEIIIFNPPNKSGLVYGKCIGFTPTGRPKVGEVNRPSSHLDYALKRDGYYSPKTEYTVIKKGIHYQGDRLFTKESLFLFAGYCRIKMDMREGDVSVIYKQFLEDIG